ncbi:hypothetical protein HZS_7977 [Henneguya salminicola]|nr:hypothetical protein HZS_7977 [Henneguya salminicola]
MIAFAPENAIEYQFAHKNMINSFDEGGNVIENLGNEKLGEFELGQKYSADLWNGFLHFHNNMRICF